MNGDVSPANGEAACIARITDLSADMLVQVARLQSYLANGHTAALNGSTRPPLEQRSGDRVCDPDVANVAHYLKARRRRQEIFSSELFADPAWDILLDLFVADAERRPVCVSSACIASGVPSTTALRWIKKLEEQRLIERHADAHDGRRQFVSLTRTGRAQVREWLDHMWPLENGQSRVCD